MSETKSPPKSHNCYNDDIPDGVLLKLDPQLDGIFTKHGVPKIRLPNHKTLPLLRKGYAQANARFVESKFARKALGLSRNINPEDSEARPWTEFDHEIPVRDGTTITIRIYQPKPTSHSETPSPKHTHEDNPQHQPQSNSEGKPVIVIMHGGGWIMGDQTTESFLARLFCTRLNSLVINIGSRNYPEVPFGIPTTDNYDAVKWIAQNIHDHGGNCLKGFILAGSSGGCTYTTICAHLARDENLTPAITGQWLTCPVLPDRVMIKDAQTGIKTEGDLFDHTTCNRSQIQNRNAPSMNKAMVDAIAKFADFDITSKLYTPFLFEKHNDLGRGGIYVQVTGLDPWRDSGRIYEGLCKRDGNRTKIDVYPGLPHCWWTNFSVLVVTGKWVEDCVEGMRWVLDGGGDGEGGEAGGVIMKGASKL